MAEHLTAINGAHTPHGCVDQRAEAAYPTV